MVGQRLRVPTLLLMAATLAGFHLSHKPLWNDEAFSYFVARHGPAATLRFIAQDTQPPLFYLILSEWLRMGRSALVMRSLSAAALTLATLPVYGAARRLFGAREAILAGVFFSATPLVVNWAQKARPYALQVLLLAVAYWGFVEVWRSAEARERWIGTGPGRVNLGWAALTLGGASAMLTQQPAGFFLLGLNAAALLEILCLGNRCLRFLVNWTLSQLLLILIWAMWLPWFLRQIAINLTPAEIALRHTNFLIGDRDVLGYLQGLLGIASLWRAAPLFLLVQLTGATIGAAMLFRRRQAAPVLIPLLAPPLVAIAGFLLIHPIFGYVIGEFVFLWIPYAILLGYAVARAPWRPVGVTLAALIFLGDAWGLHNYYATPNLPTAAVADVIGAGMKPGDGVILAQNVAFRWALAYYLGPVRRKELVGLNVSAEWDYDRLIRSTAAALRQRRDWVILPGDGQPPAVSLAALTRRMRTERVVHIAGSEVRLLVARSGGRPASLKR